MTEIMPIETFCGWCGGSSVVVVPIEGYNLWKYEGVLIQNAFPNLSCGEREQLISGYHDECFFELDQLWEVEDA